MIPKGCLVQSRYWTLNESNFWITLKTIKQWPTENSYHEWRFEPYSVLTKNGINNSIFYVHLNDLQVLCGNDK
jgi:hypothetical protein